MTRWFGSGGSKGRFGGLPATLVGLAALAAYALTLSPGLTFEHYGTDGGDLIAAARTLGVPHPTGYPTYTLLAHIALLVPIGSLAYRTNLLSAFVAALTVGVSCQSLQLALPPGRHRVVLACAAALSLAFSSLFWSQAIITEVYALLALFAALILWLLLRWRRGSDPHALWLAGVVFGLGLGNHLTLGFLVLPATVLLWNQRRQWLSPRVALPGMLWFLVGVCVYVYLPVAATGRAPVNWGDPRTLDRFLWVVTGRQYQFLVFGLPIAELPARLANWAQVLGDQFGWWGLILVLTGVHRCWVHDRRLALSGALWVLSATVYAALYDTGDSIVYLTPALLVLALWWGYGAGHFFDLARRLSTGWCRLILALLVTLPFASLVLHWNGTSLRADTSGSDYAALVLDTVPTDSLVVVRRDRPTFALWYAIYAEGQRGDVRVVNGPMLAYSWYREQMREIYPDVEIPEPVGSGSTVTSLVQDLILYNLSHRPVYATDPSDDWHDGIAFAPLAGGAVFRAERVP